MVLGLPGIVLRLLPLLLASGLSLLLHAGAQDKPDGSATPRQLSGSSYLSGSKASKQRCGIWQEGYTKLHRDILAGKAPQRFVTVTTGNGLADSMVGAVAIFYYALLSNRAFIWDYQRLGDAYVAPNINWTAPAEWRRGAPISAQSEKCEINANSGVNLTEALHRTWSTTNVSKLCENATYVMANANRGETYSVFFNPWHSRSLYAMGLQPENAFGCIIDYLLQLHPQVEEEFGPVIKGLTDPGVLKIGLQIRTGDGMLKNQSTAVSLAEYEPFFACAEEVERTRSMGYPSGVVWYLMTDSVSLRKQAIQKYGHKLHKHDVPIQVGHVKRFLTKNHTIDTQVFMHAAAENWLFGMLDVHIITLLSGYGRTAAFRSLRWQSLYTIGVSKRGQEDIWVPKPRACGLDDFDRLDKAGRDRSRVLQQAVWGGLLYTHSD